MNFAESPFTSPPVVSATELLVEKCVTIWYEVLKAILLHNPSKDTSVKSTVLDVS